MTPDPVFDKLARFSPNTASVDPAEIFFRAARASVRTPRVWHFAVVGLLLVNLALVGDRLLRDPKASLAPPPGSAGVVPVIVVVPVEIPASEPSVSPSPSEAPSPWSLGTMLRRTDPNDLPQSQAIAALSPPDPPLTARSQGDID